MSEKGVTGIVLAGGKSRRMGTEKGMLKLGSKHMIEYSIEVLEGICNQILIIENSDTYNFLGYEVIADIIPKSGPMGGIYTGLLNSNNDLNLLLSCDMPFIHPDLLKDLVKSSSGFDIVVPWHGGQNFEPMCAFYHKNSMKVFYEFIQRQNFKIPDTFEQLKTHKFLFHSNLNYYTGDLFFNVNSKEEFEQLKNKF